MACARIAQPHGLHRPEAQGIEAAPRELFNRQASFKIFPLLELVRRHLLGADEGFIERAVFGFVSSDIPIGKSFVMPPGIPADRVGIIRQAFDACMLDPEFLADAAKTNIEIRHCLIL